MRDLLNRIMALMLAISMSMTSIAIFAELSVSAASEKEKYEFDFSALIKNGEKTTYGNSTDIISDAYTKANLTYEGTYADIDGKLYLTGSNAGKGSYTNGSYLEFTAPGDGEVTFSASAFNYFVDGSYKGYNKNYGSISVMLSSGQTLQIGQRVSGTYVDSLIFEKRKEFVPVNSFKVQYKCGDDIVAEESPEITEFGVGEEYTYISNSYINVGDKIYSVGKDYTTDVETTLITTADPDNGRLKQTITLAENNTLVYNVTEIPHGVFYSEWEDILGTTASEADNGRYIASGGSMVTTTNTVPFYEVSESGYYQVLIMGCSMKRGIAIYDNEASAQNALSISDGNEIMSMWYDSNNTAYRMYSVKTVYLESGDVLTLKGFGSKNTTDNLDYVVVRRVYTDAIYGPEGISVLPGGVIEQYSYDGAAADVKWEVDEVQGVSIDTNGNLSVSENAKEGTAIIKVTANNTEITKKVIIEKPQINDFVLSGSDIVQNGGGAVYKAEKVRDRFERDITDVVQVEFSSSNTSVIEIDSNGYATAVSDGSAEITVLVSIGESKKSKSVVVSTATTNIIENVQGDTTTVNTSSLLDIEGISSFLVTTATNDGFKVNQTIVSASNSIIVDTRNSEILEITPVYTFNTIENPVLGYVLEGEFPDGFYDITVQKADKSSADIYINDIMIGNDVDLEGEYRSVNSPAVFDAENIAISGGSITLSLKESSVNAAVLNVTVTKRPSIVGHKTKITVLGGSREKSYYGDPSSKDLGAYGNQKINQSGWGERLYRFFNMEKYDIINLSGANEFDYAAMYSAFANSNHDDIVIAVCNGIHDEYMEKASEEAKKNGVRLIFATPLISLDAAENYVRGSATSERISAKAQELGNEVIDLTSISYDCVSELYGTDFNEAKDKYINSLGLSDGINLSFAGATKYAELVTKSLRDMGGLTGFNMQYEYKTPDGDGNLITACMNDVNSFTSYIAYKNVEEIGITVLPGVEGTVYAAMFGSDGRLNQIKIVDGLDTAKTVKFNLPRETGCKIKLFNWNDMKPISNASADIEVNYLGEASSDKVDNMKYGENNIPYRYYLPENYDSEKSYPIVMYLHGAGRRGSNNNDQLVNSQYLINSLLSEEYINNPDTQCIVIAPQCPSGSKWVNIPAWDIGSYEYELYSSSEVLEAAHNILMDFVNKYNVDRDRIYLSGQSMGGYGAWRLAADHSDVYAAVIPLCSGGPLGDRGAGRIAASNMAVWAFHGTADSTVPIENSSRTMITELAKYGAKNVKFTELEGKNHEIQCEVFTNKAKEGGLYEWLFMQSKNNTEYVPEYIYELNSSKECIDVSGLRSYGTEIYRIYTDSGYETVKAENGTVTNPTGNEEVCVVPVYKFTYRSSGKEGFVSAINVYDEETGYGLVEGQDYNITDSGAAALSGKPLKVDLPYGRYDIIFSRSASRADVFSNGYIIVNNTTASEQNRPTGESAFEIPEVFVGSGNLNLTISGNSGVKVSELEIARVPEKYRKPVIYVAGDSESANYYPYDTEGSDLENDALMMTGFGMQLKYFTDYKISNMGQPSATVKTWYDECFEGVMQNIKEGDILLMDFGINDAVSKDNSLTIDEMKAVMTDIAERVKAKRANPILVSPVACGKYQDRAYFTYNQETGVNDAEAFAQSIGIPFIDLNKYLTLYLQNAVAETGDAEWREKNYQVMKDNLHITQYGALLGASFICAGLSELGHDTTDYVYQYTDTDTVSDEFIRTKGTITRNYSVKDAKEFMASCEDKSRE